MSVTAVRERIRAACARVGRDPADVRLIAVTKGHDADAVRDRILAHDVLDLGENRVQEWREKAAALPPEVRWHFIGSLQRNKVKYLARAGVTLVHSLNSERLADEMQAQGLRHDHRFRALIEVDVAGEASKQGIDPRDLDALLDHVRGLDHVAVVGLMAMAPYVADPEEVRPAFARLRALRDRAGLRELSMGMSRDVEVAVEEGATLVRVGTALFEDADRTGMPAPPGAAPREGRNT